MGSLTHLYCSVEQRNFSGRPFEGQCNITQLAETYSRAPGEELDVWQV
jgi:hypothetical protein